MLVPVAALLIATASGQASDTDILRAAAVRLVVYSSYARVIALYEIERSSAPLTFDAVRLPDQVVVMLQAKGPGYDLELEQQLEFRRLTSPSGHPGVEEIRIVYDVSGSLKRVPIFVPGTTGRLDDVQVRLEIVGLAEGERFTSGSPVFEQVEAGFWVAEASTLPDIVIVPEPRRGLGSGVVFGVLVAVLGVVSLAVFFLRLRARKGLV